MRKLPDGGFVYHLDQGKTLQSGPKVGDSPDKPLLGAAATALQAWLDAAQLTEGALFRRVWGKRTGSALSDRAIALIIQRRAARRWMALKAISAGTACARGLSPRAPGRAWHCPR